MAHQVGVVAAAKLAGKDRSTIRRAMDAGRLSFSRGTGGQRLVDVAELERHFGALHPPTVGAPAPNNGGAPGAPDVSRLEVRIDTLNAELAEVRAELKTWQERFYDLSRRLVRPLPAPDHDGATQPDAPYTPGGPTYRPTNGGDPVLRTLHRMRDRVQDWLVGGT